MVKSHMVKKDSIVIYYQNVGGIGSDTAQREFSFVVFVRYFDFVYFSKTDHLQQVVNYVSDMTIGTGV